MGIHLSEGIGGREIAGVFGVGALYVFGQRCHSWDESLAGLLGVAQGLRDNMLSNDSLPRTSVFVGFVYLQIVYHAMSAYLPLF